MNTSRTKYLDVVVLVLACAGCRPGRPKVVEQPKPLEPAEVQALVEKNLPKWDESILQAKDGPKWSAGLDYNRVVKALGDEAIDPAALAPGARRIENKGRVIRLEPESGRVRYIHRDRAWTIKDAGKALGDEKAASALVSRAVTTLGMPQAELGSTQVDTEVARGGAAGEPASRTHELYRIVRVARQINGLPVMGARVTAAVTFRGDIQRMRVNWPAFAMPVGMKLRAREAVVREVVDAIVRQNAVPAEGPLVSARLAYAPESHLRPYKSLGTVSDDDAPQAPANDQDEPAGNDTDAKNARYPTRRRHAGEVVRYRPAMVIEVTAGETPYQLVVPVVEP